MSLPLIAWVLATASPSPSPTQGAPIDPTKVGPGLFGGLSITFLAIAVFFLYRSMRKQFRKIDPSLPEGPGEKKRDAEWRAIDGKDDQQQ